MNNLYLFIQWLVKCYLFTYKIILFPIYESERLKVLCDLRLTETDQYFINTRG